MFTFLTCKCDIVASGSVVIALAPLAWHANTLDTLETRPHAIDLTLFGTGGDTFIPLSFLDQCLSSDFFQKFPNFSGGKN